ncbi:Scramblase-domain-containing protein [Zopfochytrium polystomum]|nr:Scramblase-domain-containing protein [Zopfochytrium polystomum]
MTTTPTTTTTTTTTTMTAARRVAAAMAAATNAVANTATTVSTSTHHRLPPLTNRRIIPSSLPRPLRPPLPTTMLPWILAATAFTSQAATNANLIPRVDLRQLSRSAGPDASSRRRAPARPVNPPPRRHPTSAHSLESTGVAAGTDLTQHQQWSLSQQSQPQQLQSTVPGSGLLSDPAVFHPSVATLPVHIAPERPTDVLRSTSGAASVLAHPGLMVGRQLEMMNVLIGFEQANKYAIKDAAGNNVGFIAEEERTFTGTVLRQVMGTRRAFKAVVLDNSGNVVLHIARPIKWLLNSSITVSDPEGNVIGEVKQVWHLIRRKYDLFLKNRQFGIIDGGFWAWDFVVTNEQGETLSAVNRNFVGFAREIFTDTGVYAVQMESANPVRPLSLDERAVLLAAAITIDVDYFSRHSNSSGGILPVPMMGGAVGGGGGAGVPAPVPPAGGGMGMPMPVIIPGMGVPGSNAGGADPSVQSTGGVPPAAPPPMEGGMSSDGGGLGGGGAKNQWGDDAFLSDEEGGVSEQAGSTLGDFFKGFFED